MPRLLSSFGGTGMMFGYWPMGGFMWIWVLVLGGLCYWGWGWFRPRRYRYHRYIDDPYMIARERYARGEITTEEYDEIKRRLAE